MARVKVLLKHTKRQEIHSPFKYGRTHILTGPACTAATPRASTFIFSLRIT